MDDLSWYYDNRFTRWIDRTRHRLARATVCRVRGHRHSRALWGLCDRCYQFYRRLDPAHLEAIRRLHRRDVEQEDPGSSRA